MPDSAQLHDLALPTLWLDLWNGDYALADRIVATPFILHAALPDGSDTSAIDRPEAVADWVRQIRVGVRDLHYSIEAGPVIDGNLIAVRWRATGHLAARTGAMGAPIDFTGMDMLRLEGGRIVEYWLNSDVHVLLAQMQSAN